MVRILYVNQPFASLVKAALLLYLKVCLCYHFISNLGVTGSPKVVLDEVALAPGAGNRKFTVETKRNWAEVAVIKSNGRDKAGARPSVGTAGVTWDMMVKTRWIRDGCKLCHQDSGSRGHHIRWSRWTPAEVTDTDSRAFLVCPSFLSFAHFGYGASEATGLGGHLMADFLGLITGCTLLKVKQGGIWEDVVGCSAGTGEHGKSQLGSAKEVGIGRYVCQPEWAASAFDTKSMVEDRVSVVSSPESLLP